MKPPRLAEWILRAAAPRSDRRFLLADAAEEFERLARAEGRPKASRWYWGQVLSSLRPLSRERARYRLQQARTLRLPLPVITAELAQATRSISRRRSLAAVVLGTLTAAFAAALATFAIVNDVLLRPLPFRSADRIVNVRVTGPSIAAGVRSSSRPDFEDWRERGRGFAALAAFAPTEFRLTGRGEPRKIDAVRVTPELQQVFSLDARLGRLFEAADFTRGASPVVLLAHAFWATEFAADPGVLGRTLELDGKACEIVGVLPDSGMRVPAADHVVWVPLIPRDGVFWEHSRGTGWLSVVGRVRDDVTMPQAEAELSAIAQTLATEYPDTNKGEVQAEFVPLRDALLDPVSPVMTLLVIALGTVLVVACANIANLLLVSSAGRSREFAVRAAIGASRSRLVSQLTSEAFLLTATAAVMAVFLTPLLVRAFLAWYPNPLPRGVSTSIDPWLLGPALALAVIVTGLLALPLSLHARAITLRSDFGGSPRTTAGRSDRAARAILVAIQVALSFVLIVAGTGFVRTLVRLQNVDTGYQPSRVLVFTVSPSPSGSAGAAIQFYDSLLTSIREIPGVVSAGAAVAVPLTSSGWQFGIRPSDGASPVLVGVNLATTGYFQALGIQVREGRLLTDDEQRKGTNAAMINAPLAALLGGNVVGRKFDYSGRKWDVVGVIEGVRHGKPRDDPKPELIIPWHMAGPRPQAIVVRAEADPMALLPAIRTRVHALDPTAPLGNVARLEDRMNEAVAAERFRAALVTTLAFVGLSLAGLGAYSVTAYSVARRAREYGIRLALGERPASVGRRALTAALIPAAAGILAGVAATIAAGRWLESFLYQMSVTDGPVLALASLTLLALAAGAGASSARRAATINPVAALSQE